MKPPETLPEALARLVAVWRRDAAQYQKQVDEAREKGLPHGGMLATAGTYRAAAADLESTLSAFPPTATVSNP